MTVRRTSKLLELAFEIIPPRSCTFEELLLKLGLCDLDFDGLVNLLCVSLLVVGVVFDRSRELRSYQHQLQSI